ncbi:hypothetical protein FRB90_010572, partial [Tulasnella sp. 427]
LHRRCRELQHHDHSRKRRSLPLESIRRRWYGLRPEWRETVLRRVCEDQDEGRRVESHVQGLVVHQRRRRGPGHTILHLSGIRPDRTDSQRAR